MMGWHDILKREVAASTVTAVAAKIGYKRTSVSLALHGNYPGDTKYIAAAIVEKFSAEIACPHLKREIALIHKSNLAHTTTLIAGDFNFAYEQANRTNFNTHDDNADTVIANLCLNTSAHHNLQEIH